MEEYVIYLGNRYFAGEPYMGPFGYGSERLSNAKIFTTKDSAESYLDRYIGRHEFPAVNVVIPKPAPDAIFPY